LSALRVGTRGSPLAMAQAGWVASRLGEPAELVAIRTLGDAQRGAGDKARWVGALEDALLAGEIDLAVHSAKDVPGELPPGLALVAAPERAEPHDVLVGAGALDGLPAGARVGTSALRRRAQLLAVRPDLAVCELRGNVDTRLRKRAAGEVDALVLARAGLARLGVDPGASATLAGGVFVPAPGQGVLALEVREGDARATAAAARMQDEATWACLTAERAVCRGLGASCHTPVGAHALAAPDGSLRLTAFVGLPDGSAWATDELAGSDPPALGAAVAERLLAAGAGELLAGAEAMAAA
jgi:hydroxymethylbilane synthase